MLRKQSSESDPADWLYLATDRLKAADIIWAAEGTTPSGLELLQEAAERYLKGYLIAKGWQLQKTHDLVVLLKAAIGYEPGFSQFRTLADDLTQEFFSQHYPGGDWTDLGADYETYRRELGRMIDLIQQSLPQFFPPPPPAN